MPLPHPTLLVLTKTRYLESRPHYSRGPRCMSVRGSAFSRWRGPTRPCPGRGAFDEIGFVDLATGQAIKMEHSAQIMGDRQADTGTWT